MALQTCNKCGQVKPLEEFKKNYNFKSGYARTCKKCHSEHAKAQRGVASGYTLVISDTQAPAHHPDAIAFLTAVKEQFNPSRIIHIGDEIDGNFWSDYEKDPDNPSLNDELDSALSFLKQLYALFPKCDVLHSNHVDERYKRKLKKANIGKRMSKTLEDILEMPAGWQRHSEIILDDYICLKHGHKDKKSLQRVVEKDFPKRYGKNYSLVVGHHHSEYGFGGKPHVVRGKRMFWSFFTGCLINREHEYFDYSNGYEVIGCLLINNRGYPEPLQMVEDDNFRWTGEII